MQPVIIVTSQDMERIETQIECIPLLRAMIEVEPEVLALLKLAASEHCEHDRWISYERLKAQSNDIVGWNARKPELRTSACYEAFIRAIDTLIPTQEGEQQHADLLEASD